VNAGRSHGGRALNRSRRTDGYLSAEKPTKVDNQADGPRRDYLTWRRRWDGTPAAASWPAIEVDE
jgi:hypothetical protein